VLRARPGGDHRRAGGKDRLTQLGCQVKADHQTARARVATAEEKPELWRIMTATGVPYDEFQAKADREIPVVVLEPG
jgi:ABC-type proline/glycine betaine transport system substrate-binding protein